MSEAIDLDPARRREILEFEKKADRDSFFDLLGLSVSATPDEVKKAYYELSRKFHPDRFYGKKLGSFAKRVEKIFKKLSEAQLALTDPARREQYLKTHGIPSPRREEPRPAQQPRPEPNGVDAARAEERRRRMAHHPYFAKANRVLDQIERARKYVEAKDWAKAFNDLQLVLAADPSNKEASMLLAPVRRELDKGKAAKLVDEARELEILGDHAKALELYRQASSLDPTNAAHCERTARLLVIRGGEEGLKEARVLAQRAVELSPKNPDYRVTLGNILLKLGLKKNARRELEETLKLEPEHAFAKQQLRKLRWGF